MLMRQQAGDQYPRWTPKLQEIVFDTVGIRDVISLADSGAGGSGSGRIPAAQAETTITTLITTRAQVVAAREDNPAAFPGYVLDLAPEASARAILGALLDAGWTPPGAEAADREAS